MRFIRHMLGHARLESTEIYTRVSIRMLKAVHDATHPAAREGGEDREAKKKASVDERSHEAELILPLAAEAADEDADDDGASEEEQPRNEG